jgi:membrane protein implicated in regulation of membrane protease activity
MKVMKVASIISGTVFAIYAILLLVQIWSEAMSWEVFMKLTVTAVVIIVVTFGLAMLYREYIEEKRMKDDKYID